MISLRLTDPMRALLRRGGANVTREDESIVLASEDLIRVRDCFAKIQTDASTSKKDAALAGHAARRCDAALAKWRRRRTQIPISITVAEQEALRVLARDPMSTLAALTVKDRLERRGLLEEEADHAGWRVTDRGRQVLEGTPPGDLVPFAFFEKGTVVRLVHDTIGGEGGGVAFQDLEAGTELVVGDIRDGRLWLMSTDGPCDFLALERAHPKIVYVVRRP